MYICIYKCVIHAHVNIENCVTVREMFLLNYVTGN